MSNQKETTVADACIAEALTAGRALMTQVEALDESRKAGRRAAKAPLKKILEATKGQLEGEAWDFFASKL